MPYTATVPTRYLGSHYRDSSGVRLLTDAVSAPDIGAWREGKALSGSGTPPAYGTAIAIFKNGRFPSPGDPDLHCALYLEQNNIGIEVIDVGDDGTVGRTTIQWTANATEFSAEQFATVEW